MSSATSSVGEISPQRRSSSRPQTRGSSQLREAFRFAVQALWAHKTRSALTALSMLIANASVILVVSVALTGRDFVVSQIEGVGSNLIYAYYEAGGNVSASEADYITLADLEAIRTRLGDSVQAAAGVITSWASVSVNGRPRQIRVLGANLDYRAVRNLTIHTGRYFGQREIDGRSKVCLLTPEAASTMFSSLESAVGQTVKLHGLSFHVIGVFEEGVETFGQSEVASSSALVPITVMRTFSAVERVDPLYVSVRSRREVDAASGLIRRTLESRHRPGSLYRVDNLGGVLEAASNISRAMTAVLAAVAAITLGISGIFIMNIMLISVAERAQEIGVRMAVGATRRQVRAQFLMEAVGISLIGGAAGVVLGSAIPLMLGRLLPLSSIPAVAQIRIGFEPWAAVVALTVSVLVGAVFGLWPASRAAQLSPVDALRRD